MNTSVCHGSVHNRVERGSGGRGDYIGCNGIGNGGNSTESGGSSDGVDSMNISVNVGDVGGDGCGRGDGIL